MQLTYKNFRLINFPVYGLPSDNVEVRDGLLFIDNAVIDDRNQIGDTLGARRLQTHHKLFPLKCGYSDFQGLLDAKYKSFVDNKGYYFYYKKTKYIKISYHKIVKVVLKDTHTLIKITEVPFPLIMLRPPPQGFDWVGVICLGKHPWIPYEYSKEYYTPKRRKI
jgi:hypothetical protein